MFKTLAIIISSAAALAATASPPQAMPFPSSAETPSVIVPVANGCGPGWYRGPGGACHRFGRGPYPGGYWGPYRNAWRWNGCPPGIGADPGSLPQHAVPRAASRRRLEIALRRSRCGRRSPLAAGGPNSGRRRSPQEGSRPPSRSDGADFVLRQSSRSAPGQRKEPEGAVSILLVVPSRSGEGGEPGEPCSDRRTRGRRSRQASIAQVEGSGTPRSG